MSTLRYVHIITRPGFIGMEGVTVINAATSTNADLGRWIQVFNASALTCAFRSFIVFCMRIALFIDYRMIKTIVRGDRINVPFGMDSIKMLYRRIIGGLRGRVLCLQVYRVRCCLDASASGRQVALEDFRCPFEVFFVWFTSDIYRFQFCPSTGLSTILLYVPCRSFGAF